MSSAFRAAVHNFEFKIDNVYNKRVHHESIFQTVFLSYPESRTHIISVYIQTILEWLGAYHWGAAHPEREILLCSSAKMIAVLFHKLLV